jgi:hypothetical protein
MSDEDAFVTAINTADETELLAELRATFIDQPFREHGFGLGFPCSPFAKSLGLRGNIATFRSRLGRDASGTVGLARDRRLVAQLPRMGLGECYYGAASYALYPFLCEYSGKSHSPTAAEVLAALRVKRFRSEHIRTLNVYELPFPGYRPGTDNDEIHTEFAEQNIFRHERPEDEELGPNGVLKRYVVGERVSYVLLHDWRRHRKGPIVSLFAVGRSPHGGRLIGVITHQMCHNLCD